MINEIIEIIRRNIPAVRENLHSFIVVFRKDVDLSIEYIQSTAIDTLHTNKKKRRFLSYLFY